MICFSILAKLRFKEVRIIDHHVCSALAENLFLGTICAISPPRTYPCLADHGGPLVAKYPNGTFLIGVIVHEKKDGCEIYRPLKSTKISPYMQWISYTRYHK